MRRFSSKTLCLIARQRHLSLSSYPNTYHFHILPDNNNNNNNSNSLNLLSSNSKSGFGLVTLETKQPTLKSDNDQQTDDFASDVEKIYRILRKFHTRVPKLNLALQQSGVVFRPGLTERVLNRCGDAGNLGYKFFTWASKQPGYHPSYEIYKAMIKILGKMRQFGAVWALIEEIKRENPHFITAELFILLIRRFASSRMVKKAIEVFDEMPKYGCPQDDAVFGSLLDALCKNGNVKEAALVFEEMRVRFLPNLKHFTSLLYGWCKEGRILEAKHVLVQMKEAGFESDIVVFNNLLSGYVLGNKMGDAFDLLKEMRKKGIDPNANSYTIVIQGLCKADRMEEAMRVFVDMERDGCRGDVVVYTTLISGFCKWGRVEKGYEVLDRMISEGLMPNSLTYLHIMLAHEKKDELEECLELMEEMRKIGCVPDGGIYNVVVRLACKLEEVKEAARVWNEMEGRGFSPGVDNFIVMIHGFIGQGCLVEACEYFKEMAGRGLFCVPQYGILKDLLNSLLRAEKLEMAKNVWSCIVSKGCELNVSAWTIWVHALFSKGHVKEACSYCLEMMDVDVMPQPDTFAKLMRGLRKLYNRQIAAEITEKVRKMAADREITFKMYKRRGQRDLKEKVKEKADGRKRRARRRRWGGACSRANIL
ncbi:PREDICTED: putative pentatricopeptide repeat-containing protein At5g65820 [Theobroma cacao]|uniref:Pentatricopeptide repeat-containing protein At5g65820 n=1 Tax=Theobroma cacao TaxID=3641 RepID=A0AB32VMY8_THECC|nr:PREDICTED: putative pentatricopeptide repeat-containing protein At5g65820 [Theobroma cacao]